jgi:hypothetical protein
MPRHTFNPANTECTVLIFTYNVFQKSPLVSSVLIFTYNVFQKSPLEPVRLFRSDLTAPESQDDILSCKK